MATSSSQPVYDGPSVSLHVSITVAPENAQKLLELFQPCYDAVTAQPECVFFEVFQDPDTPGKFRFVENWNASREWIYDVGDFELIHPFLCGRWCRNGCGCERIEWLTRV